MYILMRKPIYKFIYGKNSTRFPLNRPAFQRQPATQPFTLAGAVARHFGFCAKAGRTFFLFVSDEGDRPVGRVLIKECFGVSAPAGKCEALLRKLTPSPKIDSLPYVEREYGC